MNSMFFFKYNGKAGLFVPVKMINQNEVPFSQTADWIPATGGLFRLLRQQAIDNYQLFGHNGAGPALRVSPGL